MTILVCGPLILMGEAKLATFSIRETNQEIRQTDSAKI
jgi:hypothetical protein